MQNLFSRIRVAILLLFLSLLPIEFASAHHVLGRPSYGLNEDSNTPPGIQGESQIGDYYITYMVYPAFPKPKEPGRINVYIKHKKTDVSFQGRVTFLTWNDSWLSFFDLDNEVIKLGVQSNDDNVYRQKYIYHENGSYIVRANFQASGHTHILDIPLRVGPPSSFGPIGMIVGLLVVILLLVTLVYRRRSMSGKIRQAHDQVSDNECKS
jgi:hypothetical protein|tara:strand:- start:2115 stop:2741 length:627 start_codon:yes stop_codon:yes gene_type:complete